jgi:hypothetical protein
MSFIHGLKKHKFYKRWNGMIQRCYNLKDSNYLNHDNNRVQIVVDHEWDRRNADGVANFISWVEAEMEKLPPEIKSKRFDIIRMERTKNYGPNNCQIVIHQVGSQKRKSAVLTFEKVVELRQYKKLNPEVSIGEMCKLFGIEYPYTLSRCLRGLTWSNVDKVEPPIKRLI